MSENLNHELPQELLELEQALAAFAPAPARLDRDHLFFEAGIARGLARAPTVAADESNDPYRELMAHQIECEPQSRLQEAAIEPPRHRPRSWRRMGSARSWRLATTAATLTALLFAALYMEQRNRPPMIQREIVKVERPALPVTPQVASRGGPEPRADRSIVDHSRAVPSPMLWGIGPPAWLIHYDQASATSSPTNYLALRHLVFTRGVDALPQPELVVDSASFTPPRTAAELLQELLPTYRNNASSGAAESFLPRSANKNMGETI